MAVVHGGFSIPGTHENLKIGAWQHAAQRNAPFGLIGATSLNGGYSQRTIDVPIWIWDGYNSVAALQAALDLLDTNIGAVGDLAELGTAARTFPNCEFLGFAQSDGPIPPNPAIGWFVIGTLNFLQLGPQDPNL